MINRKLSILILAVYGCLSLLGRFYLEPHFGISPGASLLLGIFSLALPIFLVKIKVLNLKGN